MKAHRVAPRSGNPVQEHPSHFHEDQNERVPTNSTLLDYANGHDVIEPSYHEPRVMKPAPVYLTQPPPSVRLFRQGSAQTLTIDNTAASLNTAPQQVLGKNRLRSRAVVKNHDAANTVYLNFDGTGQAAANSYELGPGEREEFFHTSAMWAFCLATKSAKITVLVEDETGDF